MLVLTVSGSNAIWSEQEKEPLSCPSVIIQTHSLTNSLKNSVSCNLDGLRSGISDTTIELSVYYISNLFTSIELFAAFTEVRMNAVLTE